MCLVIFAHRVHPSYPLLMAANRDEFHQRQTRSAMFWPELCDVLAGKDEELGGTWMGLSRDGRFAAVTNFRNPDASGPAPLSRGALPLGFLSGDNSPSDYLQDIAAQSDQYAGFNLLLGTAGELWYFTNTPATPEGDCAAPRRLPPGIYGLSNAFLDTPWPKVERGKKGMAHYVNSLEHPEHDLLKGLVSDDQLADEDALATLGMRSEMEHLLSAQFIRTPRYGTRSTTTLWQDKHGKTSWREQNFDPQGELTDSRREDFETS